MKNTLFFKEVPKSETPKKISTLLKLYLVTHKRPATYSGETKKLQCYKGARRSFTDLHMIVNYYFPKTSMQRMARALKFVLLKYDLEVHYCNATNKVVVADRSTSTGMLQPATYNIRKNNTGLSPAAWDKKGTDGVSKKMIYDWIIRDPDSESEPTPGQVIRDDPFWQEEL